MGVLCAYTLSIVWSETFEQWGAIWKDNKRVRNEVDEGMKSLWTTCVGLLDSSTHTFTASPMTA